MKRLVITLLAFICISPFFTAEAQTTSSGHAESMLGFGRAVDVANGSVFIGEPANAHQPGIVYIYSRSNSDWSEQVQLKASDGFIGDNFGATIAASDNRILIGAPEQNDERGAAYVFEKGNGSNWKEVARIALSDTTAGGGFGNSIALQNNHAFIGAPGENEDMGAVYVFQKTGEGAWTQQAHITNPDTSKGVSFGSALSVDGTRLLIGAPKKQGGAVYVYKSNESGSWEKESTLTTDRLDKRAAFGATLGLKGNQAFFGAPRQAGGSGAVYVFRRDNDSQEWNTDGKLVAYDSGTRYQFGSSLTFDGPNLLVGAPGADNRKGALYQFKPASENNTEWSSVSKIEGPDRNQGDQFAGTIAVDGDVAVTGLIGADYGAGKAGILERTETGAWVAQATVLSNTSSILDPVTGGKVKCADGKASIFGCNNVDLLAFLPISEMGGDRGVRLNDIWGWTDSKTGKEYAIVGRMDGTSFVDISDPSNPVYVGNLPKPEKSNASIWRDIKVYDDHAYVVADNAGMHGMQVVDLTDLRDFEGTPLALKEAAHYDEIHSAHNVVINKDTGFAYVVGSSGGGKTCGGGLHMVDINDPTNPTFKGCFADPSTGRSGTGYSHDAQCVTYHGPDKEYKGHEICLGANETAISIADVTDKDNPKALSTASYPDYAYVHQGWLTEDHRYFFQNDELDELTGNVDRTRTLIWDVTDLDDPQFVREYLFDNGSSDHNLYIKDGMMYQSNYVSGLQVVDISDPENPVKTGFFDTEPFGEDTAGFAGTWSNYPYFESGVVIMSSSQEGLFILDPSPSQTTSTSR
ncbi:choice-of-anchor B family protein [Fodinibius saliphilus]|uniref:choice-of-anchor B family protein n=1 Tax=Fodinibius saliphilus TaxID=1920650 RepID=UPI001107C9B6|nr:choice-of-anchor B family protein [Fodinibius saliphilus]